MRARYASVRALGLGSFVQGLGTLFIALLIPAGASSQQMPDPAVIHGRALPAPQLANGTVTVRVVREAIGNDAPGQQVRLTVAGTTRTATTDQQGRAEFTKLPGGEARAEATVDGEKLESQPFAVPTTGGLRVILVAGLAKAAERKKQEEAAAVTAPPVKGVVVLGGDSRIVIEFNNDTLFAFYLLDIVNNARSRVDIGGPLVIDLPEGTAGARIRDGSSRAASVDGRRLTVQGPFAPGTTSVQVEFSLAYSDSTHTVVQSFPVTLERTIVGVEKVGRLALSSPQFSAVTELPTENGVYLLGQGGALQPGTPLTLTLSNLAVHSTVPRYVALGIAVLIIGVGGWLALNGGGSSRADHKTLVNRREALLGELTQLEARRRSGAVSPEKADKRRQRILTELEQIYAELDASAGPQGGGEDVAA